MRLMPTAENAAVKKPRGGFLFRLRHLPRHTLVILIVLAVLLIAARLAAPHFIKKYVNRKINEMPGYRGQIGDVSLHLWRGAYSIESIELLKTGDGVPVPFFSSQTVDLSVQWAALFQGALVAKIKFYDPVINFVKGPSEETTQVGVDKPWTGLVQDLFPLNINRFEVFHGAVHYRDFHSSPKVNLTLDRLHMLATNLTNSRKVAQTLIATLTVNGRAFESSPFDVQMKLDPWRDKPTFDLSAKMEPVPLTQFNDFAEAYGKFHFQKGTLALATELAASDGHLSGYVKPLLDQIAIIDVRDVKNPVKLLWESAVAGLTRLFRNQGENRFATKIPISGSLDAPKIALLPTLGNILKNEFIKAYQGNLDHDVSLKDAVKTEAKEKH